MCIKILIANNSLSAYKFMYSIRKSKILCDFYGIATEETLNQAYIKFLKNFVILPSGDASTNFGNIDCVITAAKKFKVDYVYPGWGYLSENSDFAKALSENNIKFIGPSHEAMYMLGNKLIATKIASDLGVPVIPYAMLEGSTDVSHLNLEYDDVAKILENENEIKAIFGNKKIAMFKLLSHGQKRKLLKDITFEKLCKHIPNKNYSLNVEKLKNIWTKYSALSADRNNKGQVLEQDEAVVNFGTLYGYPLILKSASTGGGRGIYKINNMDEFRETVNSLSCDVKKEMMVCKLINNASHIELQMCADAFGNIKCIGGRDCTLQRKNQKMIEESLVIDQDAYAKLTEYSIKLLQKGKYVGVATVEFLLSEGKFYFLEINTRIQVEHPITEITSKINIPELQLRIAMDENISNIRIKSFDRHVIGCRIVAEDPWNNFLPTAGEFKIETQFEKKVFGYYNTLHGSINKNGDSQFGHIFAEGKNRKSCIKKLIKHLKSTFIDGLVTNKDFIIEVLSSKVFAKQRYHTKTLEEVIERYQQTGLKNVDCKVLEDKKHKIDFNSDRDSLAVNEHKLIDAKSAITGPDIFAIVYALDKGQNFVELNFTDYKYQYNYQTYVVSNNQIILKTNSSYCTFTYFVDKHDYYIFANDCYTKANLDHNLGSYAVKFDSNTYKFSTDYCQSNLVAPTDGVIVNIYKDQNTNIQCKEKYAEIEIMKTRISLFSETSGLINYKKAVGDVVRKGDLIAYLHVENTVSIPFSARSFQNEIMEQKPDRVNFANSQFDFSILKSIFQGYEIPTEFYEIFSNQDITDINTCVDILKMYYKCKEPNENQIKVIKLVLHKLIAIFGVDIERQLKMSLLEVLEVLDSIIIEMNYDDEIYNSLLKIRQYFSEYKFKYMNMWYNKNASEKQFTDYLSRHCSYKEGLLFALSYLEQDPNLLLTKYLCNITGKSPKEIRLTFDGNKCYFTYQNTECVFLMCGTSCQKKNNHGIVIHYNCKEDEVKNHFYIVTADETPFVTYKYNQYTSTVDIITEKLKNLDVDKNEGLVYKDIFRNLCIFDKRSHLDVIYKIDTHSGNSVMDVKNLSHAIKQILCAIKITSKKTKISESHFKITVEGKIKIKDEQIFSIVEDCIFYYAKNYCKHGVTSLIVIYENEQMHKIHLMINRGVMEKYFYTNKELHKYIIDDYEIFDAKTSDPESVAKIKEVIQNEGKEKNSNFLLRNSTISVDSFLYLIKIFFAKTNQNVSIDETYLGILEQSEPIANSFHYNQKQYILTDKCSKIGIRAFYIKFYGKSFILLMNDILHKNGSFSIDEDIFYTLMVRNARSKNTPFVFVSCNSGARIGIYDNIKDHLKINNGEFYTEQKDGYL